MSYITGTMNDVETVRKGDSTIQYSVGPIESALTCNEPVKEAKVASQSNEKMPMTILDPWNTPYIRRRKSAVFIGVANSENHNAHLRAREQS